eukprot:366573-Chlamydomonas_euryale.AAC.21
MQQYAVMSAPRGDLMHMQRQTTNFLQAPFSHSLHSGDNIGKQMDVDISSYRVGPSPLTVLTAYPTIPSLGRKVWAYPSPLNVLPALGTRWLTPYHTQFRTYRQYRATL